MTGWRLGYCCGPKLIIEQMVKLHQYAIMCAPTNSQYAAIEGLRHCGDERRGNEKILQSEKAFPDA